MEWNIYKEWLDINLYRQMVSMIYQSSSREDKMNFMRKEKENDLFYGAYKQSMACNCGCGMGLCMRTFVNWNEFLWTGWVHQRFFKAECLM